MRQYGGLSDPGLFGSDPAFGYSSQVEGWKQVRESSCLVSHVHVNDGIGVVGVQGCE